MTITYVGVGTYDVDADSDNTLTYPFPAGYTAVSGDVCVIFQSGWSSADAPTVPMASGYSDMGYNTRLAGSLYVFSHMQYRVLNGSESAPVVQNNTNFGTSSVSATLVLVGVCAIFRGCDVNSPLDSGTIVASEGAAANTFTPTGMTTGIANSMVLSHVGNGDDNTLTLSVANSFTLPTGAFGNTTAGQDIACGFAYKIQASAGAVTMPTWSAGFPDSWSAMTAALRAATAPAQVSAPTVSANAVGGYSVGWSAPANGGSAITNYALYRNINGAGWVFYGNYGSAGTVSVTGFGNGVSTQFSVDVTNSIGTTGGSASGGVTSWNVPSQVTGLGTSVASISQINLSWSAPAANGTAITDYIVQYSLAGTGSWNTFAEGTSTAVSANVTGLLPSTAYDFRVAAINAVGTGTYSSTATATTSKLGTNASLTFTAVVGTVSSVFTQTAVPVTLTVTPVAGTTTGGPVSFNGQQASLTFTPVAGTRTGGAVTKTAQVATYTITPQVGVKTGGPVSFNGQQASLTFTAVPGTTQPGTATVTAQVASATFTAIPGTATSPSVTFDAQIASLTFTAVPGVQFVGQFVNAQVATLALSPVVGTQQAGAATKAATPALVALTPLVGVVSGLFTQTAQVATVTLTPTAGITGHVRPAQIATITLSLLAGAVSGGPATQAAQVATLALSPVVGVRSGGPVTKTGQTASVALSPIVGSFSAQTNVAAQVGIVTLSTLPSGLSTIVFSQIASLAITPRASAPTPGTATWTGSAGVLVPDPNTGYFYRSGANSILDYVIEYRVSPAGGWTSFSDGVSPVTSATVTGLNRFVTYDFRVAAINEVGQGAWSQVTVLGDKAAQIGALGLVALAGTNQAGVVTKAAQQASLTFTAVPGLFFAGTIKIAQTATLTLTPVPFLFAVAQPGLLTFSAVPSLLSPTVSNQVALLAITPRVSSLTPGVVTWAGSTGTLAFDPNTGYFYRTGANAIIDYAIEYRINPAGSWTPFADGVSVLTFATVTGLDRAVTYDFRVAAINGAGQGPWAMVTVFGLAAMYWGLNASNR